MQESLALFPPHLRIGIAKHEANRSEEITLAGPVTADNDIMFWGERLDDRLVFITAILKIISISLF